MTTCTSRMEKIDGTPLPRETYPPPLPPPLPRPPPPTEPPPMAHPPPPPPPPSRFRDVVQFPVKDEAGGRRREERKDLGDSDEVKESKDSKDSATSKLKHSFNPQSTSSVGMLGKRSGTAITMKLKSQTEPLSKKTKIDVQKPAGKASRLVAQAFGSDSEEEEEMPPEAKLRMRNLGKGTPTSAGPNSFNKSLRGFSDPREWKNKAKTDS